MRRYTKRWEAFERGPCDYAVTGTMRKTYWLRLRSTGEVVKITNATPSGYDAMAWAHANKKRALTYECHAFGHKAVGLD